MSTILRIECVLMGSNLLVVNSGSSSLKFKLFNRGANKLSAVVTGLVERIGDTEHSRLVATNAKDTKDPGKQVYQASARVFSEAHAIEMVTCICVLMHELIANMD